MSRAGHFSGWARFWAAWLVLASAALFLNARTSFETIPKHQSLDTFPRDLEDWSGKDASLAPDILGVLGPGDFLNRRYWDQSIAEPVDLFIAYYPSQRTGDTIHSPQNCLPGAGWTALVHDRIQIPSAGGPDRLATRANQYIFAKGMNRVLVLYWYQAHGRTTPSEYAAKIYLIRDSIFMRRTDGAMVRIALTIPNPSDQEQAQVRTVKFAQVVLSRLDEYIPR